MNGKEFDRDFTRYLYTEVFKETADPGEVGLLYSLPMRKLWKYKTAKNDKNCNYIEAWTENKRKGRRSIEILQDIRTWMF